MFIVNDGTKTKVHGCNHKQFLKVSKKNSQQPSDQKEIGIDFLHKYLFYILYFFTYPWNQEKINVNIMIKLGNSFIMEQDITWFINMLNPEYILHISNNLQI